MIELFGLELYEVDVVVTDMLLAAEAGLFVFLLYRRPTAQLLLRRLLFFLFFSLALSSVLGAIFHAFFPAKATTAAGLGMWLTVVAAIGGTAVAVWGITALLWWGPRLLRQVTPWLALYWLGLVLAVGFIDYHFTTVILFYVPPLIGLALLALYKFTQERRLVWAWLFASIVLSFGAAAIQALQINVHPHYFNYNAHYHVVQGIALLILFLSFRSLLNLPGKASVLRS